MSMSINEIAKELGLVELSFHEIFVLPDSERERIDQLEKKGICIDIKLLREILECAGKKCCIYEKILDLRYEIILKTKQEIDNSEYIDYASKNFLSLLQTEKNIYETIGYLTLLQMDAITTTIGLLQAQNDVERIMLSKHAYTIIYEAITNDLSKNVSKEMHKFPNEIVNIQKLSNFWKEVNSILKQIMDINFAKIVRNNIDAHKNNSFLEQIALYKKCQWADSIICLSIFSKIIDLIQGYMDIINENMKNLYDKHIADLKERSKKLNQIIKELKDIQDPI